MKNTTITNYIKGVLENMPSDWLNLTTHRLDIYNEALAKTEFLEQFEALFKANNSEASALTNLPTAYDYIRLGHPLSSILEWTIAKYFLINPEQVISFASKTAPILAILRKNLFEHKNTRINYTGHLPEPFNEALIKNVYGYTFELNKIESIEKVTAFEGSNVFIAEKGNLHNLKLSELIDFYVHIEPDFGSILLVNSLKNNSYISEIQHVRRRETIAMTPYNCAAVLSAFVGNTASAFSGKDFASNKAKVIATVKEITEANTDALIGSSGLSMQYAIVMGLIHEAIENHPGKAIKIVVPPNCYGGTNDQARRVAACIPNAEVMDLPVDDGNDMAKSANAVLDTIAALDAVPFIIAEIPTNPRVEVPDLVKLKEALTRERRTKTGEKAIEPVFILDQTFCPNVHFLGEDEVLASVQTIAYVSGSKFPSGGKCTAGYCVANNKAAYLMPKIALHLHLCDNEATVQQMAFLAEQLPSMNHRIEKAYQYTREFVNFIEAHLPDSKINFVSEELAALGFTPSVFSLDLPTQGETEEKREAYKRAENLRLINLMINEIPEESKFCVSYGQLKGCYWTIPATSTQGTTKEGDKDYIVRVALSSQMDLERHKKVFLDFVKAKV